MSSKTKVTKVTKDHTFFYTAESPFSQFHPCSFTDSEGITYCCAEQYMMYHKAKVFQDLEIASLILKETSPRKLKALGRRVQGFTDEVWNEHREIIVKRGNLLKFGQNTDLKQSLMNTGTTVLVEASAGDRIWGVGMSVNDPAIVNEKNWKGLNLLGKALTAVREELKHAV